jgi:hypothetical protein
VRVAVRGQQDTTAGLDHARQLADALRHVREQHHAELRAGDVDAVVLEVERVAVHHAGLDAQLLFAGSPLEALQHHRGVVGREHAGAEARRGGMLSAPLPAATSRKRIPGRSPARRRPSLPSHMCEGVTLRW